MGTTFRITGRACAAMAAVLLSAATLAACSSGSSGSGGAASGASAGPSATVGTQNSTTPKAGGSFTMLEETGLTGAWPTGLDPATDGNGSANQSYLDAIYGNLFELGANGQTIDDLATGYTISADSKTVTIELRHGVTFSDGTPFNAAAVAFNFKRDIASTVGDKPNWPVSSITTSGDYDVLIHLTEPYAPIINTFHDSNVNWIVSPTALSKMGENAFKLNPVGAGPFTVVSDTVSSELALKKNPHYWEPGQPYLNTLTFKSVASDEAALETMEAGGVDGYEGMQTPQLVSAFEKQFNVLDVPSTSPYVIQLNTAIAPFNNLNAREAVYYATDTNLIDQRLFGSLHPVTQGFTAPNGLFYEQDVPGYRTYNLAKAQAAVKAAGGITVNLMATQSSVSQTVLEALQTMWEAAGMKVNIAVNQLANVIQQFSSNTWQASLQTAGAFDPAAGLGVNFRFGSKSEFSGVHDPKLDSLFAEATSTLNNTKRQQLYNQAAEYISQNAYAPFLFPVNGWNIAAKGVSGPGLTTLLPASAVRPEILWAQVGFTG
ncbi:MAG TPA: ABC transporter substrate-binding protein [Trebonia sp.]